MVISSLDEIAKLQTMAAFTALEETNSNIKRSPLLLRKLYQTIYKDLEDGGIENQVEKFNSLCKK